MMHLRGELIIVGYKKGKWIVMWQVYKMHIADRRGFEIKHLMNQLDKFLSE